MEATIYMVSVVAYDHHDNNLWSSVKAFTNEKDAKGYYEKESASCLADARGDGLEDEEDRHSVEISKSDTRAEYYQNSDEPEHYEVKITKQKIQICN